MKRYLHYGIVLLAIATVCAGSLAVVNSMTEPVIAQNEKIKTAAAQKNVLPNADKFVETEKVVATSGDNFIPGYSESEVVGYTVEGVTQGYAGEIKFIMGITNTGEISGVEITSHTETPGLGSKIAEDTKWKAAWTGRTNSYEFDKSVDGFAGATISPEAVYNEIINLLNIYSEEVQGE